MTFPQKDGKEKRIFRDTQKKMVVANMLRHAEAAKREAAA
jgi:hypothetical protein